MKVDELTLGEAKRLATELQPLVGKAQPQTVDRQLQIAVLERGFVYIGWTTVANGWVRIENAYNIRRWGATKGLGELVHGPTSNTVLDAAGTVKAPLHALIHLIDVEVSAWANKF